MGARSCYIATVETRVTERWKQGRGEERRGEERNSVSVMMVLYLKQRVAGAN
jgi:hypothetical protein